MTAFERLRQLLSGKPPAASAARAKYPNTHDWAALADGAEVVVGEEKYQLSVVSCGELDLRSGRLAVCDPFVDLRREGMPVIEVKPGRYEVIVTLADVSANGDKSHMREAYATLMLDPAAHELRRRIITPTGTGTPCDPEIGDDGTFTGFGVDAGTACFADAGSIHDCMPPDEAAWNDTVFDNATPECWFSRMDDASHIREGIANIPLPLARNGENIVVFHSGWGDGFYPVVGGYDSVGHLVRVHIDFQVVFPEEE